MEEPSSVVLGASGEASTTTDRAVLHKERLLRFDREFTQRTKIYDDQADYFTTGGSDWLEGDERKEAIDQEERRRSDLHDRKKAVLNIDFE